MKSNRVLVLGIILSGLISALSGLAGNLASSDIPESMKPLLHYIWPIFALVTLAGIGFALWQARQQETPVQGAANPLQLSPALAAQNRQRLLAKVRSFWIKGVLENSLHGAALIALGLEEHPEVVEHPWQLVLQSPDQSIRTFPAGTRITQVYDEAVGELLILGEPGSGKTTLLLELARDLLDRAEKDTTLPMPLVFNLSSWAVRQAPLAEWLIDEMNTKYQVPRSLGQAWIAANQVLPLLDGLDEVKKEYRPVCVGAINTYRSQHGLVPMVVCSRKAEYFEFTTRVLLQSAVVVQPLSEEQINTYLSKAGEQLEAVRVVLSEDQSFHDLATTPLMLSILTLAYRGKTIEELELIGSQETRQRHLFETYVNRMLLRRSLNPRYPVQQTVRRLSWLAWHMKQHHQTEFYLEELQANWLSARWLRLFYHTLGGLIFGIILFLAFGAFVGLFTGLEIALKAGLSFGIVIGVIGGLGVGLREGPASLIQPTEGITLSFESFRKDFRSRLIRGLKERLLGTLIFGMLIGLVGGLFIGLSKGLGIGLIGGLIVGLSVGLIAVLGESPDASLAQTSQGIKGVFESIRRGFLSGLTGGLLAGVSRGLLAGLSSKTLAAQDRQTPNEGIWRSARYAGIIGLTFALSFGLLFGGFGWLIGGTSKMWLFALSGVLSSGLCSALVFGGEAFIKHILLRLLLWRPNAIPWNYPRFLDYAAERILLRRVGSGYIFIHQLLLEYFATCYEA